MNILHAIISVTFLSSLPAILLAYIDPGTGSIIIQAIIATVVGAGVALALFRDKVFRLFGIKRPDKPDDESEHIEDK